MQRWIWAGYYNDSSVIQQNSINPQTNRNWSSEQLDQDKLIAVVLEPQYETIPRVIYQINPGEKQKRFWRQYKIVSGYGSTCWSLKLTKNSVNFFSFFRPDGVIILTTNPEGSEFDTKETENTKILQATKSYVGTTVITDKNGSQYFPELSKLSLTANNETVFQFFRPNGSILISTDPSGSFNI